MFETVAGIPAHPLLVHAVVVLLPLLVAVGCGYALVPRLRSRLDWAAVLLAVAVPVSAFLARQSGNALRARLVRNHTISTQDLAAVSTHQSYANTTFYVSIALGVLVLVVVGYRLRLARTPEARPVPVLWWALVGLTVVAGAAGLYYVYRTGDTGAHVVWRGR